MVWGGGGGEGLSQGRSKEAPGRSLPPPSRPEQPGPERSSKVWGLRLGQWGGWGCAPERIRLGQSQGGPHGGDKDGRQLVDKGLSLGCWRRREGWRPLG